MKKAADFRFYALLAAAAGTLLYLFGFVFLQAPTAQLQAGGIAQKIFYFHVPCAYAMYLSGAVCFWGSAGYLLKATQDRNALAQAGAECAVLFGTVGLLGGMLWAKKAWGVYWVWDPRLTTTLLTLMLYLATVVLRNFAGDGHAERKFAAVLGVLGTVNLPIVHYAVRKWGGTHPAVITGQGGGLRHPDMKTALILGFVSITFLAVLMLWTRTALHKNRTRLQQLEARALARGIRI